MSIRLFFLTLFALPLALAAQTIDSLRTEDEVLAFVKNLSGQDKFFKGVPYYAMADFDNNGRQDLLFCRTTPNNPFCIVVMAFGKDSFRVIELATRRGLDSFQARLLMLDGKPCIRTSLFRPVLASPPSLWKRDNKRLFVDTLTYLFDEFIHRGPLQKHQIEKIEFGLSGGTASMSTYSILIKNDSAWMDELNYNTGAGGIYKARLNKTFYRRLYTLLDHIDFPDFEDRYEPLGTDGASFHFEIRYDQGKKKMILDGEPGVTPGLSLLEDLFVKLKDSLSWTPLSFLSHWGEFDPPPHQHKPAIDSLRTADQVLEFVRTFRGYDLIRFNGPPSFAKADFDNNGRMDLLFTGENSISSENSTPTHESFVILSFGADSFNICTLKNHWSAVNVKSRLLMMSDVPCIELDQELTKFVPGNENPVKWRQKDTLRHRYGDFIYWSPTQSHQVEQIRLDIAGYADGHPVRLIVRKDTAYLDPLQDNNPLSDYETRFRAGHNYRLLLDSATCQQLYGLLNAIDFLKMADDYDSLASGREYTNYSITYDGGKVKHINHVDNWRDKVYGLSTVEQLLQDLQENKDWQDITIQVIDSLRTDDQAAAFFKKVSTRQPDYSLVKPVGGPSFTKADFDKNGLTDLLFSDLVIMSFGNDSFQVCDLKPQRFTPDFHAKLLMVDSSPSIEVSRMKRIDTLVYRYGYFINEPQFHYPYPKDSVELSIMKDYIYSYPVYYTANGDSIWMEVIRDDAFIPSDTSGFHKPGKYVAALDRSTSLRLYLLLHDIDFRQLSDRYKTTHPHGSQALIRVFYEQGKVREIQDDDWGEVFGLRAIEQLFADFQDSLKWKKIETR
ncbi:MAG: hypothetical protein JST68_21355 [Bacteroidetes bacterium]|nr:hypothetical protein [Bacteroidota bacterium]